MALTTIETIDIEEAGEPGRCGHIQQVLACVTGVVNNLHGIVGDAIQKIGVPLILESVFTDVKASSRPGAEALGV